MLDHLHRGDQIEPWAFITQGPDLARAIVDLQTHFGGVAPGDCDVLRRGVDRRHLRAKPGDRLRQTASAAPDVPRRPARQRMEVAPGCAELGSASRWERV